MMTRVKSVLIYLGLGAILTFALGSFLAYQKAAGELERSQARVAYLERVEAAYGALQASNKVSEHVMKDREKLLAELQGHKQERDERVRDVLESNKEWASGELPSGAISILQQALSRSNGG